MEKKKTSESKRNEMNAMKREVNNGLGWERIILSHYSILLCKRINVFYLLSALNVCPTSSVRYPVKLAFVMF